MKKVLIIGGAGYIGSALHQHLKNKYSVDILDLHWFTKNPKNNDSGCPNFDQYENKKNDYRSKTKLYFDGYDVIVLLAGHSSVKMSADINSTFENNVNNFLNLLPKLDKQKLIYASSSSVYGNTNISIHHENEVEYRAGNPYDFSCYCRDTIAGLNNKIEYYGLRFGTLSGPSPLSFRTDIMLNMMFCSSIWDNVIRITNPILKRPVLGITDACRAIETIIEKGSFEKRGIYNLASFNSTVESLGIKAAAEMNVKLEVMGNTPNVYDFAISTEKFQKTFDFIFTNTVCNIMADLRDAHTIGKLEYTDRNKVIKYD